MVVSLRFCISKFVWLPARACSRASMKMLKNKPPKQPLPRFFFAWKFRCAGIHQHVCWRCTNSIKFKPFALIMPTSKSSEQTYFWTCKIHNVLNIMLKNIDKPFKMALKLSFILITFFSWDSYTDKHMCPDTPATSLSWSRTIDHNLASKLKNMFQYQYIHWSDTDRPGIFGIAHCFFVGGVSSKIQEHHIRHQPLPWRRE